MKSTRIAALAVVSSLAGGLIATAAGASFNDVPNEGQLAEHITNVQEAGIATGFSDGSFRPHNALNRQQAAAWIDRSAGRSDLDFADEAEEYAPMSSSDTHRELASVEMSSPATSAGGGWVTLTGYLAAATQDQHGTGCPCAFDVHIVDSNGDDVAIGALTAPGPESDDERTSAGPAGLAPVHGIVWLPGGTTETYTLVLDLIDGDVGTVFVAGTISAQYAPMADGEPTQHGEAAPVGGAEAVSLLPHG
jgi:hypothetical protein